MTVNKLQLKATIDSMRDHMPTDYSQTLRIAKQKVLIASDVHVPYHDSDLVAEFLQRAELVQAEAVVWLGDLMDNPKFSRWDPDDLKTTFINELKQVNQIINLAARFVPTQYWSLGNHEVRWLRRNGFEVSMTQLAQVAGLQTLLDTEQLIVSDNPTLEYRDDWMLTHPAQYGSTPLQVPGKLAERFSKNIVSAHAHHWGMGTSESGRFIVIDSGCLMNPRYVKYNQQQVTTHRAWVPGYVYLDHGQAQLFRGNSR